MSVNVTINKKQLVFIYSNFINSYNVSVIVLNKRRHVQWPITVDSIEMDE